MIEEPGKKPKIYKVTMDDLYVCFDVKPICDYKNFSFSEIVMDSPESVSVGSASCIRHEP